MLALVLPGGDVMHLIRADGDDVDCYDVWEVESEREVASFGTGVCGSQDMGDAEK